MKDEELIYTLTKKMVIFLFVYYFVFIILGIIISIKIANSMTAVIEKKDIISMSFIISIAVSGMLCSVRYIKKLYKACITNRVNENNEKMKYIGNMAYFIFRPFFAFAFSIIMVFGLLSGMFVVTGNLDFFLNKKFIYLCVILSSFLGYSIGGLLDKFEKISKETVGKII